MIKISPLNYIIIKRTNISQRKFLTISSLAEWETERLTELWHLWDSEIRKINSKSRYFSNIGIDADRAAELAEFQ